MNELRITYTSEEGTILHGDVKPNDPVSIALQRIRGWRWSKRNLRWFMPIRSGDPRIKTIETTEKTLRTAGYTVTVHIDRSICS